MTFATRAVRSLMVVAALLGGSLACSEPGLPEPGTTGEAPEDVLEADVLDPARDELLALLDTLTATVTEARDQLDEAATADDPAVARAAVATARELLLDDPDVPGGEPPAVFPARTSDREASGEQDDLLSATLAVARETGGGLGRGAVETLRDSVAGDLGAWERDAQGVVGSAAAAVRGATDVEAVAEDVLAIPGDGVRALAWTFLAEGARDPELLAEAAERAGSHLSVVLVGLTLLAEQDPTPDGEAS